MNRRVCVWVGPILGCSLAWGAAGGRATSAAFGQVPPAAASPAGPVPVATVPAAVVAAQSTATAAAATPAVRTFINVQVAGLLSPSPGVAQSARLSLEAGCPRTAGVTTSYRGVYAQQLAAAALPVLAPATPLPAKVKLGVALASVGNGIMSVGNDAQGVALVPAVSKLLADTNDAAALWGLKAARPMVICLIAQPGGPGKTTQFADVVNAVAKHGTGNLAGFLATDAYRALVVNPTAVPNMQQAAVRPLLKPLFDPVMDLLESRTKRYATGLVPSPDAESIVPLFLSRDFFPAPPATVALMTDPQKARAVQDLVNLIDAAGQRAALANPQQMGQLVETLKLSASALNVMSGGTSMRPLVVLPPTPPASLVAQQCATAFPNMSVPFPALVKPPTLPVMTPPPPPPAPAAPVPPVAPAPPVAAPSGV